VGHSLRFFPPAESFWSVAVTRHAVYRRGHLGVSLLVFAPIGLALVFLGRPTLAVVGGAAMLWLAMLPDWDHRIPLVPHRGPTHSLAFALLVGGVGAAVGAGFASVAGGGEELVAFGFGIGALAVLAHLLADALTPAGVPLLWPLSRRDFSVYLTRADNTIANYVLLAIGVGVTAAATFVAVRMG
jgi:inner membrane protein